MLEIKTTNLVVFYLDNKTNFAIIDIDRRDSMNQNTNQNNVHQVTPEDLQKTLVLNLKDVEEVVRVEKKHSKRPSIILGIVGIALIFFGSTFQITSVMKEKKEQEQVAAQRREPEVIKTHIDCNKTNLSTPTNTDDVYSFSYYFEDGKLVSATKVLSVVPTPGSTTAKEDLKKYKETFKNSMFSTTGYDIYLTENETGFIITVEIDYSKVDASKLNQSQNNHLLTRVEYKGNETEDYILKDMENKKFNCK